MRKTHRISWMPSGWILPSDLGVEGGGTACLTIGCPDDFYAVRLGFANVTKKSWIIDHAIGCVSSQFHDYVNPVGGGDWTTFTFAGCGVDNSEIISSSSEPKKIVVAGNLIDNFEGNIENTAWTWTDWTSIRSTEPDPTTGMRVLMLRALVPSLQRVCFANSSLVSITGDLGLNRGFDCFVGGIKFNYDKVTDATLSPQEGRSVWHDNQLASGSLFPIVQFLTKNSGIVGLTTGDSHHQGTSTTDQVNSYLYQATTALGSQSIGRLPFGMVNCAVGGLASQHFFPRLSKLLQSVNPSYVVLPGWSYNDQNEDIHADQIAVDRFFARLIQSAELCRSHGALPIFLTPFPRDAEKMLLTQLNPWKNLRRDIIQMSNEGAIVLDATSLLGNRVDGDFDGTYLKSMSDDGSHPNDNGHREIASSLITILRNLENKS